MYRFGCGAAVALAFALGSVHSAAQTFSIDAYVISVGSAALSGNACFRLQATIAEPAPGYSSSTDYSISSGFRYATQNMGSDEIFFAGLEDCTP